jgi:hypothetical protein
MRHLLSTGRERGGPADRLPSVDRSQPPPEGDHGPNGFDRAEGPGAGQEPVGAGQCTPRGEADHVLRGPAFEGIHHHHEGESGDSEGGEHHRRLPVSARCRPRPISSTDLRLSDCPGRLSRCLSGVSTRHLCQEAGGGPPNASSSPGWSGGLRQISQRQGPGRSRSESCE